ncbi:SRPBCC family protein [Cryptosporangium aurantiacum]|uniref:Uncharacterized conserved protein YndB, AHSA1/START domain n=1 Tax=Cryptosporangium aurantiacum TaxID=134849 RepID=A0A1M7PRZ5_9ACTN|nr:SRPBCC domain-containing protein [Cryptosporangium aurantiacum]SHN20203.1 Uncharacterized conserved protein YndB, AHSA1/START domain [Cryptosporangium aurantiacum]
MTVINTTPDLDAGTLTVVAEFPAPPKAVWQLWADPRLLERWWGPPTWPSTFREHDFTVGGVAKYHMTGPEGDRANGWWRFVTLDEPHTLEFEDGFADEQGNPNPDLPTTSARVDIAEIPTGTRMTITNRFGSTEELEKVLAMGMAEGMAQAVGQIDELLASA